MPFYTVETNLKFRIAFFTSVSCDFYTFNFSKTYCLLPWLAIHVFTFSVNLCQLQGLFPFDRKQCVNNFSQTFYPKHVTNTAVLKRYTK